jgi:hypothetical protein
MIIISFTTPLLHTSLQMLIIHHKQNKVTQMTSVVMFVGIFRHYLHTAKSSYMAHEMKDALPACHESQDRVNTAEWRFVPKSLFLESFETIHSKLPQQLSTFPTL